MGQETGTGAKLNCGRSAALGSDRSEIAPNVGNVFFNARIPKNNVLGIQMVFFTAKPHDILMGSFPVDAVRGGKNLEFFS
jgi:hypothetical protein